MSRFAKIITMDEFQKICKEKLLQRFPHMMSPKIKNDIAKINFDLENYRIDKADPNYKDRYASDYGSLCGYPCGWETLPNGLPVLFVNAGGDWEYPICFCIYFDGTQLRGYIPEDGNVYNKQEKCAYGSEEDPEEDQENQDMPDGDPILIRKDVMNRIKIIG